MGVTYFYLPESSLLVSGYWGRVDTAASQEMRRARAIDPGLPGARAHVIDLSQLEGTTASARMEADTFRSLASVYVQTFGPLPTAIVAGPMHVFGMARIFETVAGLQNPPVPVRVVQTWADAEAFLQVDLSLAQAELNRRRTSMPEGAPVRLTYIGGTSPATRSGSRGSRRSPHASPPSSRYCSRARPASPRSDRRT